ncbi:MAG TPA: MarR family transcriptional regulator [Candidatus Nanopelagicales bacterium]|jgi:DNA-binding MarR family transcriptional regulator
MDAARPDIETLGPPQVMLATATYLVGRLSVDGRRRAVAAVTSAGLRLNSYAVLACLHEFGSSSQRDLSERLGLDPSDVVAVLDELESHGYVSRTRCTEDRRRYDVSITASGTRVRKAAARALEAAQDGFLAALDPAEREQLTTLLRRMHDQNARCS